MRSSADGEELLASMTASYTIVELLCKHVSTNHCSLPMPAPPASQQVEYLCAEELCAEEVVGKDAEQEDIPAQVTSEKGEYAIILLNLCVKLFFRASSGQCVSTQRAEDQKQNSQQ